MSPKLTRTKEKKRKKATARREKGGDDKKAMVALLVSILTALEFLAKKKMLNERGSFGGNVFKNPAYLYEANWKVLSWPHICTAFDDFKGVRREEGVTHFTYG